MQSDVMAGMREVSLFRTDTGCKSQSLPHILVRPVWFKAQGIHHQTIDILQMRELLFRHTLHVSDVDQSPDAVAQDWQGSMHHPERHHLHLTDEEGTSRINLLQLHLRDSGILMFGKTIGNATPQPLRRVVLCIKGDFTQAAERTQVIDTSHMVVMLMRDEHPVNGLKRKVHHLLPEVGSAVNQDTRVVRLHQGRRTQTLVVRVIRPTHLAGASDLGNPGRCPAA